MTLAVIFNSMATFALAVTSAGLAQAAEPAEVCAGAPFHQFDFVLGKFVLLDEKGSRIADEHVDSEMHGCVVHEYFISASGSKAESFSFYDPVEKSWYQYAVGLHLVFRLKGGLQNGAMTLGGTTTKLPRNIV